MKNLPEKIYLNLNMTPQEVVETKDKDFHEATKTWEITWSEERLSEHDPEYMRKNAFIEKACEFLDKYIKEVMKYEASTKEYEIVEVRCMPYTSKSEFIEDFKKYMEE